MADITQYNLQIKISESGADQTAKEVDKMSSSLEKLKSTIKGIGIGATLTSIFGKLKKCTLAAADYIETMNYFSASMGNATQKATEFINKAEEVLGLDPKNLMDSISAFQNLGESLGIDSDRAYIMSQNLTQLAADLSSYRNISFEDAQRKILSGFSGQVKPLREYGIALTQASLQETAYSLGIQEKVKNMTQAQKAELIYYQIMTSTTKMQGDLGRTLMSPANALRLMKAEFNKLGREIGNVFIPIMMKIIPVVIAVTEILLDAVKAIAKFFHINIGDYKANTSDVGNILSGISDDIGGIGDAAEDTTKKLNKMLMPFDELNNITLNSGAGSGIGGIGGGFGGSLLDELPEYDMFENVASNIRDEVDKIKEKLEKLKPLIETIGTLFATWKIASSILNFFSMLKGLNTAALTIALGLTLVITGIKLYYGSVKNILNGDLTAENLLKGIAGAGATGLGIGILASAAGLAIAPVAFTVAAALTLVLVAIYGAKAWTENYKKIGQATGFDWDGATFTKKMDFAFHANLQIFGFEDVDKNSKWGMALEEWHEKYPILDIGHHIKNWWQDSKDFVMNEMPGDFEQAWENITETLSTAWEDIKGVFDDIGDFFSYELPSDIESWFDDVIDTVKTVLGINSPSTKFKEIGQYVIEGFLLGITDSWDTLLGGIQTFFNNCINKVKEIFGIHSPSTVFQTIGENLIQGLIKGINNIWNGLTEKFENIKGLTNFSWSLPSLRVPRMYWSTMPAPDWAAKILRALSLPTNVPKLNVEWVNQYAKGGYPETGQLFIANEAGPELIGNIGNRTAVANQDQITTAIANATYQAMSRALAENGQNDGQPIIVNVGNEQLYKGYTNYRSQQSNMYGINI